MEELETQKQEKSFAEKHAGTALWIGTFVIWPATTVVISYLGYKTARLQLSVEVLKMSARQQ